MDKKWTLAAEWLARQRGVASRLQRERLAAERVLMLWKRRRNPRQAQLMQEEEDWAPEDLKVDIQKKDEGFQELVRVREDQEP